MDGRRSLALGAAWKAPGLCAEYLRSGLAGCLASTGYAVWYEETQKRGYIRGSCHIGDLWPAKERGGRINHTEKTESSLLTGTWVPCKAQSSGWANLGTECGLYLTVRNEASQVQLQSPVTQAAHCTHRDPESRIQASQNGPFPARLPRFSRQQETRDHSRACLPAYLLDPGRFQIATSRPCWTAQDCLVMWKKPPTMRRCAHGTRDCLGMAGAHWPVLLHLQPAGGVEWGGVGWGGVGTERNVLSRFLVHCISLVYPGTEHTTRSRQNRARTGAMWQWHLPKGPGLDWRTLGRQEGTLDSNWLLLFGERATPTSLQNRRSRGPLTSRGHEGHDDGPVRKRDPSFPS